MMSIQKRVSDWMLTCFGSVIAKDKLERGDRFLEESLELLQSGAYPKERIQSLVDYVYNRPVGEPAQEVGGVMVCLAAYCTAHSIDMDIAAHDEVNRIWKKIPEIRAKHATKQTGSALPGMIVVSTTDVDNNGDHIERLIPRSEWEDHD